MTSEAIRRKVWAKYWPKTKEGEFDPDVAWVGPLLDGLIEFGIFNDRQQAKTFFYEVGESLTGDLIKGGKFSLTIQRAIKRKGEWPFTGTEYGPTLELARISGTGLSSGGVEPGEITNSPSVENVELSLWDSQPEIKEWDPTIAVDERFGLHQLNVGDRIEKRWYNARRKEVIKEAFVLRRNGATRVANPTAQRDTTLV